MIGLTIINELDGSFGLSKNVNLFLDNAPTKPCVKVSVGRTTFMIDTTDQVRDTKVTFEIIGFNYANGFELSENIFHLIKQMHGEYVVEGRTYYIYNNSPVIFPMKSPETGDNTFFFTSHLRHREII